MARIRSVHPGIWTDEAFATVSMGARLLFIGITNECDDRGAFEWKPITLKMRILPADNADVPALLDELCAVDMIRSYEMCGRRYGAVRNFRQFQRPKKPNYVHPMPESIVEYSGKKPESSEPEDDEGGEGSPPVPHQCGSDGEKAPQMDIGVGIGEEVEGKEERVFAEPSVPLSPSPPKRRSDGCRLPEDWRPSEAGWSLAISLGLDPERLLGGGRNYWHSKAGANARKVDWDATWRIWCNRETTRTPVQRMAAPRGDLGWAKRKAASLQIELGSLTH